MKSDSSAKNDCKKNTPAVKPSTSRSPLPDDESEKATSNVRKQITSTPISGSPSPHTNDESGTETDVSSCFM